MSEKNRITTSLLGSEYTIVGSESKEYLEHLCLRVGEKINLISNGQNLKPMKISVLTAINFCDELIKAQQKLEICEKNLKAQMDENEKLKAEIKVLEEEKKVLKGEIQSLRKNR